MTSSSIMDEEKSGHVEPAITYRNKSRILKDLAVLTVGLVMMFSAFKGLANLQSTMNHERGLGMLSVSVVYIGLMTSSLLLPILFLRKLGCKLTLVVGVLAYAPYVIANVLPTFETLIPTSLVLGLGAGPLWSGQMLYLSQLGREYASLVKEEKDVVIALFFGIFYMGYGTTDIWGNLISYYALKPANGSHSGITNTSASCGIRFRLHAGEEEEDYPNFDYPTDEQRYLLVGIYLLCIIVAALLIALFLDNLGKGRNPAAAEKNESVFSLVFGTFRHLKKRTQLFMIPLTIFEGAQRAFFMGEFTMAYIACAWGIYHVGYVFICYGTVVAIGSFITGRLNKYVPQWAILLFGGCVCNVSASIWMFLWEPRHQQYHTFFAIAAIWGLSDAVWHTHINTLYGVLFKGSEEEAFSNFMLWESLGYFLCFFTSKYLSMVTKISSLLVLLTLGMMGFACVEFKSSVEEKKDSEDEQDSSCCLHIPCWPSSLFDYKRHESS